MKDIFVYGCQCTNRTHCPYTDWSNLCNMTTPADRSSAYRARMVDAYRRLVDAAVTYCGNNTNMLIATPPDINTRGIHPELWPEVPVIIDNRTFHVPDGGYIPEYVFVPHFWNSSSSTLCFSWLH